MVKRNYQSEDAYAKGTAKAVLKNRPVSLKYATELARELRGTRLDKAEAFLQRIMGKQDHLPLRKYVRKVAHRKGEARSFTKSGRYPVKTAKNFLELLETVKANADYKGMDAENLMITSIFACKGYSRVSHQCQGKIGGKMRHKKSAHIEIVVREAA